MKHGKTARVVVVLAATLLAVAPGVPAAGPGGPAPDGQAVPEGPRARIEARRDARAPEIARLRGLGVLGENRSGHLEILPGATVPKPGRRSEIQRLVRAENADRDAWIAAAAAAEGLPEDRVRARLASGLREAARPGEWIQDPDGRWYRK